MVVEEYILRCQSENILRGDVTRPLRTCVFIDVIESYFSVYQVTSRNN